MNGPYNGIIHRLPEPYISLSLSILSLLASNSKVCEPALLPLAVSKAVTKVPSASGRLRWCCLWPLPKYGCDVLSSTESGSES